MIRPIIERKESGSSGEKIIEMVASRLSRVDLNSSIYYEGGDTITIVANKEPEDIKNYIRRKVAQI